MRERGKWFDVGPLRVFVHAQHRLQQGVEGDDEIAVRAVRGLQGECLALVSDLAAGSAEHGDIRATEAVDGLLAVADDETLARVAVEQSQQIALAGVGVLEFVHQQRAHFRLPARAGGGMIAQERQRPGFQIVEVERAARFLEMRVGCQRVVVQAQQLREDSLRQGLIQRQVNAFSYQCSKAFVVAALQFLDDGLGVGGRPVCLPPDLFHRVAQGRKVGGHRRPIVRRARRRDDIPETQQFTQWRSQVVPGGFGACQRPIGAQGQQIGEVRLHRSVFHESAQCGHQVRLPHGPPIVRARERGDVQPLLEQLGQESRQFPFPEVGEQARGLRVVGDPSQRRFDRLRQEQRGLAFIERLKAWVNGRLGRMVAQQFTA
ncbi:MAG: hypothetical protein BWY76_02195 [bacterium ADurb.Bin429]|nr:MAG: hypothetical protein BWY76_02195 [bacterium ADurb.Bin429]